MGLECDLNWVFFLAYFPLYKEPPPKALAVVMKQYATIRGITLGARREYETLGGLTEVFKEKSRLEQIGGWGLIEQEEEKLVWFNSHYFSPKRGMYASVRFDKIDHKWVFEIMSEGSTHFEPYKHFHSWADAFEFAISWIHKRDSSSH